MSNIVTLKSYFHVLRVRFLVHSPEINKKVCIETHRTLGKQIMTYLKKEQYTFYTPCTKIMTKNGGFLLYTNYGYRLLSFLLAAILVLFPRNLIQDFFFTRASDHFDLCYHPSSNKRISTGHTTFCHWDRVTFLRHNLYIMLDHLKRIH